MTTKKLTENKRNLQWLLGALLALGIFLLALAVSPAVARADDGTPKTDMPTGQYLFITLEENTKYRWNANDSAMQNSVVHLDTGEGDNCRWRLDHIENEWYGIKHIKTNGTDRFADIDGKSKSNGAVVHLWESNDSKVKGNNHRQFAFYYLGKDAYGNERYYIKNRNSGKWLSYEGSISSSNKTPKIMQTDDKSKRKVWLITKAVIPKSAKDAGDIQPNGYNYLNCEIFKANDMASLNRANDTMNLYNDQSPTRMHFYVIGTSPKWRLTWVSKYDAYQIEALTINGTSDDRVLIPGNTNKNGTYISLTWHNNFSKNQGTEQLWRLEKQSDGSYKIKNAVSGLYLEASDDKNESSVYAGLRGTAVNIYFIGDNSKDKINFAFADDWMKTIPDDALLSSVNIPATHDTGTAANKLDIFTVCQSLYYGEQLNAGVRSFDIRCDAKGDTAKADNVDIVHGGDFFECTDRDGSTLKLQDIFDDSLRFLKAHPSETIILTVKPDAGSAKGLENAVADFIQNNAHYVYRNGGIPSMAEARGRIVFLRRFSLSQDYTNRESLKNAMGLDISNWDDFDYSNYKYAYKIYDKDSTHVYVQDHYKTFAGNKWDYILGTMRQTTGSDTSHPIQANSWVFNYTSCAGNPVGLPLELTRDINPNLYHNDGGCIDHRFLGTVMLNFADEPMSRLIYETNKNLIFEPKPATPAVSIREGQLLGEAQFTVPENTISGTWIFNDPGHRVSQNDKGKAFKATFIPADTTRYKETSVDLTLNEIGAALTNDPSKTEVTLEWPAENTFTYTGKPVSIRPAVKGVKDGDTCEVKVINQRTNAGTYTAVATLESDRYVLKDTDENRTFSYTIKKAVPNVTFPKASLTYGTTLEKAKLSGASGEGDFHFSDTEKILHVSDSGKTQAMTFLPYNPNYETVTKEVPVTVNPKKITVRPARVEKTYGSELPALKLTVSGLENGDTRKDLHIRATLVSKKAAKKTADAGGYTISYKTTPTWNNADYNVVFKKGIIIVQPKTVTVKWNRSGTITYTGKSAKVNASLKGVLPGDTVSAVVENGTRKKAGTYTARITRLKGADKYNYVMKGKASQKYRIVK